MLARAMVKFPFWPGSIVRLEGLADIENPNPELGTLTKTLCV